MKRLVLLLVLFPFSNFVFSQDFDHYYIEFKEGYEPQNLQKTVNANQTLTLSMNNTSLAAALNEKPVYTFEKAFRYTNNPILNRVYLISLPISITLESIINRVEIENIEQVLFNEELAGGDDIVSFSILPDDYDDIITGGRNTALDLIRAPQAWTITKGEGQVIGIVDGWIYEDHEDLIGKVDYVLDVTHYAGPYQYTHGAGVAGMAAANTNNNKGISAVAPEATIASSPSFSLSRIEDISQVSGVKVINASWGGCQSTTAYGHIYNEMRYQELLDDGYLVVAAGGNGSCPEGTLYYPAAYDATLSVTTVGHRVAPTYYHDIVDGAGTTPPGHYRSWKDVYRFRPDIETNLNGHNLRANIDVTAPGHLLVGLKVDISTNPFGSSYNIKTATSPTAPIVTGVAALVFAANPNLTAAQVKDIILNTADDIYHIPWNQPYIGQLGTGRINAYRAVLTAKCMDDPNYIGNLDLMVRNSMLDYGYEPDDNTENNVFWDSPDIWVRHNPGESYIDVHQNPEYGQANYIYVRVTNRSCVTSSPSDVVNLYWAKASTGNGWPDLWMGNVSSPVPLGGPVSTLSIPELQPGQEAILEFEWYPPDPEDYHEITADNWHFCLLAMIDSNEDPLSISGNHIQKNSNNIALKNVSVVQTTPSSPIPMPKPSATVIIGNIVGEIGQSFGFEFFIPEGKAAIYEEAEVLITLNENAYNRWEENGSQSEHIEVFNEEERQLLITGNRARLLNMHYPPGEWDVLSLSFNFLTEEVTGRSEFEYYLAQTDSEGVAVGGETFHILRDPERPHFNAEGNSYKNTSGETEMVAVDIGEPAVYNWYTPEGQLFHSGKEFAFVPDIPGDYLLEVVADTDGHKDYFKLSLSPNQSEDQILSLSPNPASNTVTVAYQIDENAGSASLTVASFFGSVNNVYPIDLNDTNQHLNINLTGYPTGHYAVVLTVDGQAVHAKQLIIN